MKVDSQFTKIEKQTLDNFVLPMQIVFLYAIYESISKDVHPKSHAKTTIANTFQESQCCIQ